MLEISSSLSFCLISWCVSSCVDRVLMISAQFPVSAIQDSAAWLPSCSTRQTELSCGWAAETKSHFCPHPLTEAGWKLQ